MIGSEKALIRSVLLDGSWIWGVSELTDVPLGSGEHVYAKRGGLRGRIIYRRI